MSTDLRSWLGGLVSEPSIRISFGEVSALVFDSPLRFKNGIEDSTGKLLASLIEETLPGYGTSPVPARCLARAYNPVVFTTGSEFMGFLAYDRAKVDTISVGYLTLGAIFPPHQNHGLVRRTLERMLTSHPVSVLAASTNVPDLYVMFERFSSSWQQRAAPYVLPALEGKPDPIPQAVLDFGRRVLSEVLRKPAAGIPLDAQLVRRHYRDRDLQAVPMREYLSSRLTIAERSGKTRAATAARGFLHHLCLDVGDSVLVLADMDGELFRMATR